MMFPKVLAFKLYVFGLTTWNLDYIKNRKFNFDLVTPQEIDLANTISKAYCRIDSNDIWTISVIDQTLNQIEYMALDGKFEDELIALQISEEIMTMIDHTRRMAEKGKKFMPGLQTSDEGGKFDLYHNEITGTNNIILVHTDKEQRLYHTFDTPNFIYTSDQEVCELMNSWFDRTVSNSISMSIHSSRNRNYYFNKLEAKINAMSQQLKKIFG